MGNSLIRFICGSCSKISSPRPDVDSQSLGHQGVTPATVGVSALAQDLLQFDNTSQVPDGLSHHVTSSKKTQANWYKKLSEAWREAKPPPKTPEEATRLVVQTLKGHHKANVEGLLAFYGLPAPHTIEAGEASGGGGGGALHWPQGVKYELHTLPVDAKAVADGDTITVYVDVADPRESSIVPREVQEAAVARAQARAVRNYQKADALHKTITDAGYRVISGTGGDETLARKYRIRLRGIDAPESKMPYGTEAKQELLKLVEGKRVKVYVYENDRYGRYVGDVHCGSIFVQEKMLKSGFAWHYTAYDRRPELAAWEKEARAARVGLWSSSNPEKPWEWRKDRRNGA